jgi:hypothetical protein
VTDYAPQDARLEVCATCGNPMIETSAWLFVNTGEDTQSQGPVDHCWCHYCEETTGHGEQKRTDIVFFYPGAGCWYWLAPQGDWIHNTNREGRKLLQAPAVRAPLSRIDCWPEAGQFEPVSSLDDREPREREAIVEWINATILASEIAYGRAEPYTMGELSAQMDEQTDDD